MVANSKLEKNKIDLTDEQVLMLKLSDTDIKKNSTMTLEITKSLEIIETMENYITKVRPAPEIRNQLDIGYEIEDQSVILQEIRPSWKDPTIIRRIGYAKATYVKSKNIWNVFWQRSDLKWHIYPPKPTVKKLSDFLKLVDDDKHACFKG